MNKNDVSDWEMFGLRFFGGGKKRLLEMVSAWLDSKNEKKWIATVNPEFVMKTAKDREFFNILQKTDINVVDGIGIAWAAKYRLGRKVEVISGSDLIIDLCALAEKNKYSVYFLGGWGERSEMTAKNLQKKFPKLKVVGYYAGKSVGEDERIKKALGTKRIDILFVAYGMKTQEEWIARNIKKLNVGLAIGVGRSFDYYSGVLKRAPNNWRKLHLEWLYSLIQEPKRWRRQLELPKFVLRVLFPIRGRD